MITVRALPVFSSMVIAWVTLFFLFLMLKKFLYTPVSHMLIERKEKVQNNLEEAKNLKEEAFVLKTNYEKSIDEAKAESQEIIEHGRKRGEEVKEDIIVEAKKEAEDIVKKARKDIDRERDKALLDVKMQAGEMAVSIASKILEQNVDMASQQDLINKFVNEVGTSKWQN